MNPTLKTVILSVFVLSSLAILSVTWRLTYPYLALFVFLGCVLGLLGITIWMVMCVKTQLDQEDDRKDIKGA